MPIYEYQCMKCRNEFEAMQKFSDSPLKKCPSCGGAVKRLISRSSFQLKGSGWYVTDYAKKGSSRGHDSGSSSEGSSETSTASTPSKSSDE